ncbi:N-acetylmuramoyl-L-alanine amidase [Salinicola salarius]|uniref:N-acetylmuramoyl-L-alanine amidase n=1 Tax=Salinicola salarius TaxID=430457 RepID=UPI0026EC7DF2|nr:N-acetylmuramoyl-L-alanine amidase [Salinicola salarius]
MKSRRQDHPRGTRSLLTGWMLLTILAGCAGSPTMETRNGYIADRAHRSDAYNQRIRYLILHYTDSEASRAMRTLLGPDVSSHYLVPRSPSLSDDLPQIWQLVDEKDRAWHAGVSAWEDRTQLNDTSIGVEIVNRGPQETLEGQRWEPYPEDQIRAVIALAKDVIRRYRLPPTAILGHSDIAPSRKIDPGPRFPWKRLHDAGVGAWPRDEDIASFRHQFAQCSPSITQYQRALSAYGYSLTATGMIDDETRDVTRAFQMHFRPASYSGQPDHETAAILWALLARYRPQALLDTGLAEPTGCRKPEEDDPFTPETAPQPLKG